MTSKPFTHTERSIRRLAAISFLVLAISTVSACTNVQDLGSGGEYFASVPRYPYAVVPPDAEYSESVRWVLIRLGFKVVMGEPDVIRSRHAPQAGRAIAVSCTPFRIERYQASATRTSVECEAVDLFTDELVYRGVGDYATVYASVGNPYGAVELAFGDLPRASARGREMAELPMRRAYGGEEAAGRPPQEPGGGATRPPSQQVESTGTAFFVSETGHLVSNHHVIEGCRRLRIVIGGAYHPVSVVGVDVELDVALLSWRGTPSHMARFREGRFVRAGDPVVAVGYPLRGLLADEATVTTGTISAMAGIGNDRRFLQISAPVQAGNSGGPLLDESGRVVGVVVAKLDAARVFEITGDLPQNVNFAINGQLLTDFLNTNGVDYRTSAISTSYAPADVAADARQFTVPIECTAG